MENSAHSGPTHRILIIDDEQSVCDLLRDFFHFRGYDVTVAATGGLALDILRGHEFDVALLDIHLPDMNGINILEAIKARAPETICYVITGNATREIAIAALKHGATDLFMKPVSLEQVDRRLAEDLRRRDGQHQLVESGKKHRMVAETANDAIIIVDAHGLITYWNPAAEKIFGFSREEMLSQSLLDHIIAGQGWNLFPGHPAVFSVNGNTALLDRPIELLATSKDGRVFPVEMSLSAFPKDGQWQAVGIIRDITERKENEEKLRGLTEALQLKNIEIDQRSQRLEHVLDGLSNLFLQVIEKKDFSIRYPNPELRKCYETMACQEENCPCFGQEAMACWRIVGTLCGGEPQGTVAKKIANCTNCVHFQQATADFEIRISEQFNDMMHLLEGKNLKLFEAHEQLKATQATILQQEKMASIGQLAAGVAHEINNPIGFIASNLNTLKNYVDKLMLFTARQTEADGAISVEELRALRKKLKIDVIADDIKDLITESLDGVERVKTIVTNLKTFSRVDDASDQPTDLNQCIETTLNIVWNELKYKAVVHKEYGALPAIRCRPQQLNQVFMNLLVNAAQAIDKQGEIRIRTWARDSEVHVAISDTGNGIAPENLARIFEPFFTTKAVGKGTGLGLAITYDLVKKHGGQITVESKVGQGTTFTLTFPALPEDE